MSKEMRDALSEQAQDQYPSLKTGLSNCDTDIVAGDWDLVAYSFQIGFERFWDLAKADQSGLLDRPLLSVFRQSIELALKSSLMQIDGEITGNPAHRIKALFEQLQQRGKDYGLSLDDELAENVAELCEGLYEFDPFADRFRYPTNRSGKAHGGLQVDLDELYKMHWMVTTWCEGVAVELKEELGISTDSP